MPEKDILDSWKEICAYLKRSEKTCRKWEHELGLPIHRIEDSPKARVFAYKEELDRWMTETQHSEKKSFIEKVGLKRILISALIVGILAIIVIVIWHPWSREALTAVPSDKPSIAVLPFSDLSQQRDQEYFCDGMTEEIIARLSTLKGWKVIPRTSMIRYKNTDKDITEIGQELDVAAILEGSIRKEGDDIRVNVKLIRVEDNISLWSDTYEKKLESVFAIQSDVAEKIVASLKVGFSPEEKAQLERTPTENLTAYNYYLRGRVYYIRHRKEDNERAIGLFKKALEFDPDFALAYSGLGDSYAQRAHKFGFPDTWLDLSIEASDKAISLRPDLSEGYKALGLAYSIKGWNQKAIKANQKAIALNANNILAIGNLGNVYRKVGEFEKAFEYYRRAFLLDPAFPATHIIMGWIYLSLDDYAKAEKWLKNAYELQPHHYDTNDGLLRWHLSQGKYQQAIDHAQKWLSISPNNCDVLNHAGFAELFSGNYERAQEYYQKSLDLQSTSDCLIGLGYIYWKKGQLDEARKLFSRNLSLGQQQLEQGSESRFLRYNIAVSHAIQGNKEEAYKWLQKAINVGWRYFRLTSKDPMLENLHNDVRFKKMMADVKKMVDDMRKRIEEKD